MAQSLRINEKEYLPSTELAKQFNYTSDYISKLARDEKILGTQIGRQWFIEPESLRFYLHKLEIEKTIQKENLSQQRKMERLKPAAPEDEKTTVALPVRPAGLVAGHALAMAMAVFLFGFVSFTAIEAGVGGRELAAGVRAVGVQIATPVAAGARVVLEQFNLDPSPVASSLLSNPSARSPLDFSTGPQLVRTGQYTVFPPLPERLAATNSVEIASKPTGVTARLPFSDEIIIEEVDGEVVVRPVFKDMTGGSYQLSVERVKPETE